MQFNGFAQCNAFEYVQTYRLVNELLSHIIIYKLYALYDYALYNYILM